MLAAIDSSGRAMSGTGEPGWRWFADVARRLRFDSLASFRRFGAIVVSRNLSLAPVGPRRRSRLSLKMRLRWANSISTFFRSRRDWRCSGVPAKPLATSRVASCTLPGTLRRGCPGQHLAEVNGKRA